MIAAWRSTCGRKNANRQEMSANLSAREADDRARRRLAGRDGRALTACDLFLNGPVPFFR
jgi:hypothetical protein